MFRRSRVVLSMVAALVVLLHPLAVCGDCLGMARAALMLGDPHSCCPGEDGGDRAAVPESSESCRLMTTQDSDAGMVALQVSATPDLAPSSVPVVVDPAGTVAIVLPVVSSKDALFVPLHQIRV